MADYAGYIEVGAALNSEELKKELDSVRNEEQNKPIVIKAEAEMDVRGLDQAVKETQEILKGIGLKGIEEDLEEIDDELDKTGKKFKRIAFDTVESTNGIIKVTEKFTNGLGETKTRISEFQKNAKGTYELIDTRVSKIKQHESDYNEELDLTAKKLMNLNRTVESSKVSILEDGQWSDGWQTVITTLNGAGQELRTITTEYEKAGFLIKETRQEIKENGEEWKSFGGTAVEQINLAEQAYKSLLTTLKQKKQLDEETHRLNITDRSGKITGIKGTSVDTTIKTFTDQYENQYQTIIRKWQDDLGNTIEQVNGRIKQQGKEWEDVGVISKKVTSDEVKEQERLIKEQERLNKTLREKSTVDNYYTKTIDGIKHSISEQVTSTRNYAGEIERTSREVDEFTDTQGRLVRIVTSVNAENQRTIETFTQMGNNVRHLGQSFSDVIVKVAKFYVASLPIRAVQKAITETIQSVKDFDTALTEFKKVSDLSGESLDAYTEKLEKLGELTARTRTEMVQMATEFKRSGYSDDEAADLAQIASLYQNIADEELSAADASAVLISQMKAFQNQGIEAEHVIDAINEVANKNAVSSGDIGKGLTQAGAALSTYGNTFDQTIGLITAGTEIFQGKSQQVKSCCLLNIA